jgi:D-alanyl-lipoteichoic acid acyltransferase DltB (MBOAT superfamily)
VLFNSYIFIFLFLPITLLGFFLIGKKGHHRVAISWLVGASLLFYGWWNPAYLFLILASILFNYAFGVVLGEQKNTGKNKLLLSVGVAFNLGLIAYYKYANFFIDNLNLLLDTSYHLETIILPLAISFFTFQQIAYLVDAYKGQTREYNFLHYCLFVTFFPQLIAGPIVHHKEMLPQFAKDYTYIFNHKNMAIGLTIFIIGLFKKVALADSVSVYASPVFQGAEIGLTLTFFEAWTGALAYTLQLYFDFSGYSDMAIGIARMFGIKLPLNFNSPYKATNIVDFWRRWHITLSRFLRDYVYFSLGGNRKGKTRRYINLFITMLLGGLWHGAGWTFIIWGALHGLYLCINHGWHSFRRLLGNDTTITTWYGRGLARLVTFTAIVVGWVFFRAESVQGATGMLIPMFESLSPSNLIPFIAGLSNISLQETFHNGLFEDTYKGILLILSLIILALYFPNTQQIMIQHKPALETYVGEIEQSHGGRLEWNPSWKSAMVSAFLLYYVISNLIKESEFLYFNF